MNILTRLVVKELKALTKRIETDNCELTQEEALKILEAVANEPLSKEDACIYLNISRSKFDELVNKGLLPKGKKRRGFKELVFYKEDLRRCASSIKQQAEEKKKRI